MFQMWPKTKNFQNLHLGLLGVKLADTGDMQDSVALNIVIILTNNPIPVKFLWIRVKTRPRTQA